MQQKILSFFKELEQNHLLKERFQSAKSVEEVYKIALPYLEKTSLKKIEYSTRETDFNSLLDFVLEVKDTAPSLDEFAKQLLIIAAQIKSSSKIIDDDDLSLVTGGIALRDIKNYLGEHRNIYTLACAAFLSSVVVMSESVSFFAKDQDSNNSLSIIQKYNTQRSIVEDNIKINSLDEFHQRGLKEFIELSKDTFSETQAKSAFLKLISGKFEEMSDMLDLSAPEDKAVFYCGNSAKGIAHDYAKQIDGKAIEDTKDGYLFENWNWIYEKFDQWGTKDPERDQELLWIALSERYAKLAQGKVTSFQGSDRRVGNIWETYEKPILQKNGNTIDLRNENGESIDEVIQA